MSCLLSWPCTRHVVRHGRVTGDGTNYCHFLSTMFLFTFSFVLFCIAFNDFKVSPRNRHGIVFLHHLFLICAHGLSCNSFKIGVNTDTQRTQSVVRSDMICLLLFAALKRKTTACVREIISWTHTWFRLSWWEIDDVGVWSVFCLFSSSSATTMWYRQAKLSAQFGYDSNSWKQWARICGCWLNLIAGLFSDRNPWPVQDLILKKQILWSH